MGDHSDHDRADDIALWQRAPHGAGEASRLGREPGTAIGTVGIALFQLALMSRLQASGNGTYGGHTH